MGTIRKYAPMRKSEQISITTINHEDLARAAPIGERLS
jgi:hypothetical protein